VDNSQLWVVIVSSGASIIAVLVLFIRSLISERKPVNGNGAKQSRDCWEQHQTVINKLDTIQKTLDDRMALFSKVQERLDDINITILRGWDGSDRRKL
jgi:hypothetical protein